MIIYKCKMCNGNLDMSEHKRLVKCNYCDTYQSVPSLIDEDKAEMVNRANRYRQNGEFDRATSIYEQILKEDASDPEIHWSIVLCKFGVEYVEDPSTKRMVPTINRTQSHSILQDSDYQNAIAIALSDAKQYYMAEADKIDQIQRSIWRIAKDAEDYDVFISYKELGPDGKRTKSSMIAQNFYEQLSAAGIKTFFSRVSLASKIGNEFEPYIFSALNSAKVMLVLGTNRDEFIAPWVKNEWSRFRKLAASDSHKRLIPCVLEATIDDLPDELQPFQAQDMNKEGSEQEILDIVKNLVSELKKSVDILNETDAEKLMKNGETYIVLKDFVTAEMIFRDLCEREPEDHRVWWGRIRSVTKDFTDTDALKQYNQDLKIWMDFIKRLAPSKVYTNLVKQYVSFLKKISKQSVFEEIENVKKIKEQTREKIAKIEDELSEQTPKESLPKNEFEEFCDELEANFTTASAEKELFYKQKNKFEDYCNVFSVLAVIIPLLCFIPLIFEITWPIIVGIIIMLICIGIASIMWHLSKSYDPMIVKVEGTLSDLKPRLNKAKHNLEAQRKSQENKKDNMQNTLQKCKEVVENADRYLAYDTDAISNLLFAITCSEIGEDTPMDHDLFKIRERTFQSLI